ncbi:c-type cytochrome biogenesis protein CcmI [Entomohabitans teleogrylli]|uniref:c-type cytochrome biogenesis protein CcmI n=1 Tax=Entomohabitans teleogrylli TaxID=1384589 RepID=UPI00073D40FF|nr:c-type cytochrome biogenesis protein CcmI [Entomohabitans teleogrylli]
MTVIIIVIAVLLLSVAGVMFYPWGKAAAPDRDALNQAFFESRLKELEEDNPPENEEERSRMVAELQHNLLQDIPEQSEAAAAQPVSRWALLPGVIALAVLSIGVFIKTTGLPRVQEWRAVTAQTPELMKRVMDQDAAPLTMEEMARLGLGLRTRLQEYPENIESWVMLGRIGMVMNNATTATQAFEQAYKRAPNNEEVKLGYAEVLTRSADPQDNQLGSQLLREVLRADHTNVRALSLLAFNAFEQQNYQEAIGAWQILLRILPQNDQRRAIIERSISQAKVEAGIDTVKLTVTITLSSEAEKSLPESGVVFVSVGEQASEVPVAVKRIPLSHFPLTVTLDDTSAMMPNRLLSSLQQGVVRVHISPDGTPERRAGDWYGESAFTALERQQPLSVIVSRQQP